MHVRVSVCEVRENNEILVSLFLSAIDIFLQEDRQYLHPSQHPSIGISLVPDIPRRCDHANTCDEK